MRAIPVITNVAGAQLLAHANEPLSAGLDEISTDEITVGLGAVAMTPVTVTPSRQAADVTRTLVESRGNGSAGAGSRAANTAPTPPVCRFFLEGNCRFGHRCRSSHSLGNEWDWSRSTYPPSPDAGRSVCRFFLEGRCPRGAACRFEHPVGLAHSPHGDAMSLHSPAVRRPCGDISS